MPPPAASGPGPAVRRLAAGAAAALLLAWPLPGAAGPSRGLPPEAPSATFVAPGGHVTGLAHDGEHLWAADAYTDHLYRIDARSGEIVQELLAPGNRPMGLAWDGTRLWVADRDDGALYPVDPKRKLVGRPVRSPVSKPRGLAWDGRHLWLSSERGKRLLALDPTDGTTIRAVPAPSEDVTELAWDGTYLWATDRKADLIYVLDPGDGEVLMLRPTPGPHATGLAYAQGVVFVADYQLDTVATLPRLPAEPLALGPARSERMEFVHTVRNRGPGVVAELEVYLAIPEELPGQQLLTAPVFVPTPSARRQDGWGQRVAHFHFEDVAAGAEVTVRMRADVRLRSTHLRVLPEQVGSLDEIPATIREQYLVDASKYDIGHPALKKAVQQHVGDERRPDAIARRLARHVQQRLRYELSGGWNAAPRVYERGTGSCSEYTFLFVALCRAAGLPARYAGALVVRGDDASTDDVFHRWPEVYLPRLGWVPYDVQAGDRTTPGGRARAFGRLDDIFLITTRGGGASRYLGFNYNRHYTYRCRGRCAVESESFAEWAPLPAGAHAPPSTSAPATPSDSTPPPAAGPGGAAPTEGSP